MKLAAVLCVFCLPTVAAIHYSAVFGDHAVLQRATAAYPNQRSALYGSGADENTPVTVTLSSSDADVAPETVNAFIGADSSWKAFLKPQQAGGEYTITAQQGSEKAVITGVTFGDVWFCSGQSNMELNMHFTFNRNDTYQAVGRNEYSNIRLFHLDHAPAPYESPVWLLEQQSVLHNWTIADTTIVHNKGEGNCIRSSCFL